MKIYSKQAFLISIIEDDEGNEPLQKKEKQTIRRERDNVELIYHEKDRLVDLMM